MKNVAKIVALALVLVMTMGILASCGGLSGKYEAVVMGSGSVLEFKGNKVEMTVKVLGQEVGSIDGTYKVNGDKITFDFVDEDKAEDEDLKDFLGDLKGELSFEKDGDNIKIGGVTYKKAD